MTSIGSATLASGLAELAVTDVKTSETSSYVKAAYRYCSTPDKSDLNYETATVASDGGSIVSDGSTSQSCSTDIVVYIIETAYTSTGLSAVISPPSYGTTCNSVASVCKTASNSGSYYCSDGDSESVLTVYCSAETSFNYAITGTTVSTVNTLTASV